MQNQGSRTINALLKTNVEPAKEKKKKERKKKYKNFSKARWKMNFLRRIKKRKF
jgi:hypothetical protein